MIKHLTLYSHSLQTGHSLRTAFDRICNIRAAGSYCMPASVGGQGSEFWGEGIRLDLVGKTMKTTMTDLQCRVSTQGRGGMSRTSATQL